MVQKLPLPREERKILHGFLCEKKERTDTFKFFSVVKTREKTYRSIVSLATRIFTTKASSQNKCCIMDDTRKEVNERSEVFLIGKNGWFVEDDIFV